MAALRKPDHPARFEGLQRAARLWPLDYQVRFTPAVFCSENRWKGSGEACMAAIRRELALNPYAYDFRRNLAGFLLEAGRKDETMAQAGFIKAHAPHLKIVVPVNVNPATR